MNCDLKPYFGSVHSLMVMVVELVTRVYIQDDICLSLGTFRKGMNLSVLHPDVGKW